jgi:hypothetical protein
MKEVAAKNGERAGSSTSSCVWPGARSLGATGLHTVFGGASGVVLPEPEDREGRGHDRADAELSTTQYPPYRYRRIRICLGRDGHRMSVGRAYRLRRAAGLQLPRNRPRKRVAAARPPPQVPCGPNQVWSYDVVIDRCANAQQLKCRRITDEFRIGNRPMIELEFAFFREKHNRPQ